MSNWERAEFFGKDPNCDVITPNWIIRHFILFIEAEGVRKLVFPDGISMSVTLFWMFAKSWNVYLNLRLVPWIWMIKFTVSRRNPYDQSGKRANGMKQNVTFSLRKLKSRMAMVRVCTCSSFCRHSMVLSSRKPCWVRASHVFCTCSMQGEKDTKRPPASTRAHLVSLGFPRAFTCPVTQELCTKTGGSVKITVY